MKLHLKIESQFAQSQIVHSDIVVTHVNSSKSNERSVELKVCYTLKQASTVEKKNLNWKENGIEVAKKELKNRELLQMEGKWTH